MMPYKVPTYLPPLLFRNSHSATILPFLFRKQKVLPYTRSRIETPDLDFLDLDQIKRGNARCVLLVHGLEGSARSTYITSLGLQLLSQGWDIAALNLRGCSEDQNLLFRSYNSGSTDDLATSIRFLEKSYAQLVLIGFSLGGNIVLKFAGDEGQLISQKVTAAIGISVPCHLSDASTKMESFANRLYMYRFVQSLKSRLRSKINRFPSMVNQQRYDSIRTIRQLDEVYTAPANGHATAEDYYLKCSSIFVIDKVSIPTLLINAVDDPFLSESCYPKNVAEEHPYLHFYAPKLGGHVGFWPEAGGTTWKHEEWILNFLQKQVT